MRLVLEASCDQDFDEAPGCFVIDVEPEYAKQLVVRAGLVKQMVAEDATVYKVVFWDYSGDWYQRDYDAEADAADPDAGIPRDCSGDPMIPKGGEPARVDVCLLHVSDDRVWWTALVKHTSLEVSSDGVSVDKLKEIAHGEPATA